MYIHLFSTLLVNEQRLSLCGFSREGLLSAVADVTGFWLNIVTLP